MPWHGILTRLGSVIKKFSGMQVSSLVSWPLCTEGTRVKILAADDKLKSSLN